MSFCFHLLIVEDDIQERKAWEGSIEIHNATDEKHGFSIKHTFAKSLVEANRLIEQQDFNAAIVDIRLEQDNAATQNNDGNEVISRLLECELAVIAVFTGELAQVDIPIWAKSIVNTFRKGGDDGEGNTAVMEWLKLQLPMVKAISDVERTIKREMTKLFTHSIWPRWKNWVTESNSDLNLALGRHMVSHVHATLLESSSQEAHPEEWYFIPPIRDGIRTGDLIRNGESFDIVITPRCDLAVPGKTETIQLAKCKDVTLDWSTLCTDIATAKSNLQANTEQAQSERLQKKVSDKIESLRRFTQHKSNKYQLHFIPQMKLIDGNCLGPFFVEFSHIRAVDIGNQALIADLINNRVASLTPEFLPSLVERLGSYFSRIGTPNYYHPE
jgi:hypothetical protein